MEIPLLLKALILGIVEGLTEFLPISSTGHLILAGALLDFDDAKGKAFYIIIQAAAMLAVCWEYRARIGEVVLNLSSQTARGIGARRFAFNVAIAFVPAALLGLAFASNIKMYLFSPAPVALAFIVGGIIILWAERREHAVTAEEVDDMRWTDALKVGLAQCVALIPGMSRSGATIIGGLLFGLSRKAATEFSFFLAIPTLFAATVYELFKDREFLSFDDSGIFLVGGVASFISAFIAVRALLRYISRHDFTAFAWYRIVFGIVVLITAYGGGVEWTAG